MNAELKRLSIIWNITARCPFNCAFCAMDASPRCAKPELSFSQKLRVVENLQGVDCRVDLSGGEVMTNKPDHMAIIRALSQKLGKDCLGISCSGKGIDDSVAAELSFLIGDAEMTMDANPDDHFSRRPKDYHATAANATDIFKRNGIKVGLQTVLTRDHLERPELLDALYHWMREHGVDEWSLLRFFPAGRGVRFPKLELNDEENRTLVDRANALCVENPGFLDISYQLPGTPKDANCRCVRKSVGITPTGDVTACFWAINGNGDPNPDYMLGNLVEERLSDILASPKAVKFCSYLGKCPL